MTRWTRTVLACTAVTMGLVALAGPALADNPETALPNSGTLTWTLGDVVLNAGEDICRRDGWC